MRALALLVLLCGCHASADAAPEACPLCVAAGVPEGACSEGFASDGAHGCAPILPEKDCSATELATPGDRACRAVGVDTCAAGFLPDETGGCHGKLPEECPGDQDLYRLGDETCGRIAECGTERWGVDAVDPATTLFVDATYSGSDSDGTEARPFAKLEDAVARVDAAKSTIAVAAGKYRLGADIVTPVAIRGRCPSMVHVDALAGAPAAITASAALTLRNLALSSATTGVHVKSGTTKIVSCLISDTMETAIRVDRPGVLELTGSKIARAHELGIASFGADVTLDRSMVTQTLSKTADGGIAVVATTSSKKGGKLVVRDSVIELSDRIAVSVRGAKLSFERSIVRLVNMPDAGGAAGIYAQAEGGVPPELSIVSSTIEGASLAGVAVFDGTLTMDRTTVVGVTARDDKLVTAGLVAGRDPATKRAAHVVVTRSTFAENQGGGVAVLGGDLDLSSSIVRDNVPGGDLQSGEGLSITDSGGPPKATVRDVLFSGNASSGVTVGAGAADLLRIVVRDTFPGKDGKFGTGLVAYDGVGAVTVTVRSSVFRRNHDAGLGSFGAQLDLEGVVVDEVLPRADGSLGHGIVYDLDPTTKVPGQGHVVGSFVRDASEIGINVVQSNVEIDTTTILATRASAPPRGFGDGLGVIGALPGYSFAPTSLVLRRSRIDGSARAGVAVIGASFASESVLMTCNAIDLDAESVEEGDTSHPPQLDDRGATVCGCDARAVCKARSAHLSPVAPPASR